jgi:formylglycine-generating enzyme required for sulfatase activity
MPEGGEVLEKKCPVCFFTLDASLLRCPRCGWDFPPASGEVVEAARWLLGRIASARRLWLSRRSSASLEMVPPVKGQGEPDGGADGPARAPAALRLVRSPRESARLSADGCLEFADIPSGLFSMGTGEDDAQGQEYERPAHGVVLSRPFRLAKYPVTQTLWEFCMGYNPSLFRGRARPVENVTWDEAMEFIGRLGEYEGQPYRLPTEAEWEYAARAGTEWPFYFGAAADQLSSHAWFAHNSGGRSQAVGLKEPNPWGLHDMLGNVWEWVSDWYGDYDSYTATNPQGPREGITKVIRGGAWGSSPWLCRVATRSVKAPGERSPLIGLRLALDGPSDPPAECPLGD